MLKFIIKVAVLVLVVKELWLLLQIPSVANAVFSFIMVGQIPGTDTTLSPDQMMWLLAAVFVVLSALIFRKDLLSLFRRHGDQPKESPEQMVETTPEQLPAAPTKATHTRRTQQLQDKVAATIRLATHYLRPWAGKAREIARKAITSLGLWWHVGLSHASRLTVTTYIVVSVLAIASWSWLKPRIERFDHWLDKKLHQNEYTAALLTVGSDMQQTITKWWADFKAANDKSAR